MNKILRRKYPEVISVRVTLSEKTAFDELAARLGTTKSLLLRKKIKRSLTNNNN